MPHVLYRVQGLRVPLVSFIFVPFYLIDLIRVPLFLKFDMHFFVIFSLLGLFAILTLTLPHAATCPRSR